MRQWFAGGGRVELGDGTWSVPTAKKDGTRSVPTAKKDGTRSVPTAKKDGTRSVPTTNMNRRIVITGMGVITPLGDSVEGLFAAQIAGRSGVGPITRFDASTFPTTFAAEVRDFDLARYVPRCERWRDAALNSQFAAAAAQLALRHAGLLFDTRVDRNRFGVYLGTGEAFTNFHGLMSMLVESYRPQEQAIDYAAFGAAGLEMLQAGYELEFELHRPAGHLGAHFDLRGPNESCLTACAASSQAVGEATEMIRDDAADIMLAGGSHSMIHPLGVTGFNLLTALSTRNDDPQQRLAAVRAAPRRLRRSAKAPACWCWRNWSMPAGAAPTFMPS